MKPYYQSLLFLLVLLIPCWGSAITTVISQGGDLFLGEEGVDLSYAVPPPYDAIAYFPPGSSPGRDTPLDVRRIGKTGFAALPSLYFDRTGPWYQWNSRTAVPGSIAFVIREPRLTVRILQASTHEEILSGIVPRGTAIFIQVETNTGSVAARPGYNPSLDGVFDLMITTPEGGVLNAIETRSGSVPLTRITPYSSLQTVPSIQTGGWDTGATGAGGYLYAAGTYVVQPRFAWNRVDENVRGDNRFGSIRSATITIGSERAKITSRKDRVIRGNSFSVTISGSSGIPIYFWIDSGRKSGEPGDQPPMILFAQDGISQDEPGGPYIIGSYQPSSEGGRSIRDLVPHEPYDGVKYYALVTPDRDGKRTLELRTSSATDDTNYRLRIESPYGGQRISDSISISVAKGSVSVATENQVYSIGEEVRLSGQNSESCDTYLFITGPNLPSGGGKLENPRHAVRNGDPSSFTIASGDCETWDYRLFTGELGIDAGTYQIYAVPVPVDRNNLGSVPYQTLTLTLRRPYVSMKTQETTVARGDSLVLYGRSTGSTRSGVAVWIFGKNFFRYDQATVGEDGTFEYELSGALTSSMVDGQYTIIIQHPMSNGEFDIWPDGTRTLVLGNTPWQGSPVFRIGGPGALTGPAAANALITALNSQFIDDTYTRFEIRVASPKIEISPASLEQEEGKPIVIEGKTNLAAGKRLLVEITDNRFVPTRKGETDEMYGYSTTIETWQGNMTRYFSFIVPAGRLSVGEYRIIIQAVESEAMTSELLTIVPPRPPVNLTIYPSNQTEDKILGTNKTTNTTLLQDFNRTMNMSDNRSESINTSGITQSVSCSTLVVPDKDVQATKIPQKIPGSDTNPLYMLIAGVGLGLIIAGLVGFIVFRIKEMKNRREEESGTGQDEERSDSGEDMISGEPEAEEEEIESS